MQIAGPSLEDQLEDYLERKEWERLQLEALIATPPHPLYRKRRAFDSDGTTSTVGTFAWQVEGYQK